VSTQYERGGGGRFPADHGGGRVGRSSGGRLLREIRLEVPIRYSSNDPVHSSPRTIFRHATAGWPCARA